MINEIKFSSGYFSGWVNQRRYFDPPGTPQLHFVPNKVLVHHTNRTDAWEPPGESITREEDEKLEKV